MITKPPIPEEISDNSTDSSSKSKAGKSYVVFGKKDNTNAIELSDIAAGIGGYFIFSGASKNIVIFIAEVINGVF
jgi:hypothetical protein